jgi:HAD superfamily hydrolase (TIGR01549 family)
MAPQKRNEISTVFFDFGDTLVEGIPAYLRRITEVLGEFGFHYRYEAVAHAFTKADYLIYLDSSSGLLTEDGQYLPRFLTHFSECLGAQIDWETMLPKVFRRFDERPYERTLCDGAQKTLQALRDKGYRLGMISNNDGSCRAKCEMLKIADYFELIIDSAVEGVRKPAPKIFELALERMKISTQEAAHVGDMYGSDVLGARDVGIKPIWYNTYKTAAFGDYQPEHVIERLDQMLEFL